jgi:integrase
VARQAEGRIADIPAGKYWPALFLVAYDTSQRSGSLFGIRMRDVKLHVPTIFFRWSANKSWKEGTFRIRPETAQAIADIATPTRTMLFPEPYSQTSRYHRMKAIFDAAKLPTGHGSMLQKIRRTSAAMANLRGVDATAQLQHSSDETTRQFYLPRQQGLQAADVLDALSPSASPNAKQPTTPARPTNPAAEELRKQARELLKLADRLDGGEAV